MDNSAHISSPLKAVPISVIFPSEAAPSPTELCWRCHKECLVWKWNSPNTLMGRPLLAVKRKDPEGLPLQICKSQWLERQAAASWADLLLVFSGEEASKVTALVVLVPSSHKFKSEFDSSSSLMDFMSQVTLSQKLRKEQLHVWTSSHNSVASYQTWYIK